MDATAAGKSTLSRTEPKTDVQHEVTIGFLVRESERRNEETAETRGGGAQVMAEIRANVARLQAIPPVSFPGKRLVNEVQRVRENDAHEREKPELRLEVQRLRALLPPAAGMSPPEPPGA